VHEQYSRSNIDSFEIFLCKKGRKRHSWLGPLIASLGGTPGEGREENMVIALWAALAGFAAATSFASESGSRYVFCLLDSEFQVKSKTETVLANTAAPDTVAVQAKAQSLATWPSGIRLNTAAIDGVWMAFEPPADPGDVVFVSDTDPVQPLLALRLDAMCGECIYRYDAYGDTSVPHAAGPPGSDPVVSDLEERFNYGMNTTAAEKASVAQSLAGSGFPSADGPIRIHVLKVKTVFPSTEGITFIAYYVVPAVVSALHPFRAAATVHALSTARADALGRCVIDGRTQAKPPLRLFVLPVP
jgi:hypothetical protein